ncbi:ankyrin-3-like isoform X2 [Ptychodera flava]|uniref:ankyrin-3-like isoform X2 n=1 Tax=Ptychodera flava TaxID=63121 RepID=UPI00396A97E8
MAKNPEIIELISDGVPTSKVAARISEGIDIHASGNMGLTALHHAAHKNNLECVKLLLSNGGDPNIPDNCGYTPVHIAAKYGHEESLKELCAHGADIHVKDEIGFTPLHLALLDGKSQCAAFLLRKGANPNMYYKYMGYEIHTVNPESPECLELLLQYGADPNVRNARGLTALHVSCQEGNDRFVQLLLLYSADLNAKSQNPAKGDVTPLRCAVMEDEKKIVGILLENGADPNEPDSRLNTPLHHAATQGNVEMAQILLRHNANVTALNESLNQPLHKACRFSHEPDMIRILLENGADPNALTDSGETPMMCVIWKYGHISKEHLLEIDAEMKWKIALLVNYGAKVNFVNDRVDPYSVIYSDLHKVDILSGSMNLLVEAAERIAIHDSLANHQPNFPGSVREQLDFLKSNPRPLKHFARSSIRKYLGERCPVILPKLPLPQSIIKYLQFL